MDEIQNSKWILGLANQIRRMYNISTDNNRAQTRILYFVLAKYPERDNNRLKRIRPTPDGFRRKRQRESGSVQKDTA